MATYNNDAEEEFVVSDVIAEADSFLMGDLQYDANRVIQLIDMLTFVAEDSPTEQVIETGLALCEQIGYRKDRQAQRHHCHALIRKSQLYFYNCNYVLSRQTLDVAQSHATQQYEQEIEDFRAQLQSKVTRDGKIALFWMAGLASALVFWWLSGKKKQQTIEDGTTTTTTTTEDTSLSSSPSSLPSSSRGE